MKLKNVTLEVSAKPFKDNSDETMKMVCETIFNQWHNLTKDSDMVSIMLWLADGSEILAYKGNEEEAFEWAYWLGVANRVLGEDTSEGRKNTHQNPEKYIENPPELTYGWLKKLVSTLKETGTRLTGKKIRVGATFDPGPEFAVSDFKYKTHREICQGHTLGGSSFVTCNTVLKGDCNSYAGFPDGIPDGTNFGEFLGKQSQAFMTDMGYDYIWFSNGFGFGLETWGYKGSLFDGEQFMPEKAAGVADEILEFWKLFSASCSFQIETRGSNLTAGIEIATDACPVKEIYETFKPAPPINSPWAALNSDFGLEFIGWMSHIAELPEDDFSFRFYTHDPWFMNSPWLDRYGRQPHDIYMPLSIGRMTKDGSMQVASGVEFLTIDDSYGNMPEQVPNEVIPHIQEAFRHQPDAAGLFTIVYPFDEYNEFLRNEPEQIAQIFADECYIRGVINQGMPINTVVSTGNFNSIMATDGPKKLNGTVLLVPANVLKGQLLVNVFNYAEQGGGVMVYGSLSNAEEQLLDALGIKIGDGLSGELLVETPLVENSQYPKTLLHADNISAGEITEQVVSENTKVLAQVCKGDQKAAIAVSADLGKGKILWFRSENSFEGKFSGRYMSPLAPDHCFIAEMLPRLAVAELGFSFDFLPKNMTQKTPIFTVCRHQNGFFFSGFTPNVQVAEAFKLPFGAPLFMNTETELKDNKSCYSLPKSWRHECRVFVKQADGLEAVCVEKWQAHPDIHRKLVISGLKDAEVIFFPEPGFEEKTEISINASGQYIKGDAVDAEMIDSPCGTYFKVTGIDNELLILECK